MKTNLSRIDRTASTYRMAAGTLALAVCLGLPLFAAAQDQAARSQTPQDQQNQAGDAAAPAQTPDATAPAATPDAAPPSASQAAPPSEAAPQAQSNAPDADPQTQAPQARPAAPPSDWHYNPAPQDAGPQGPPAPNAPAAHVAGAQAPAPQASAPPLAQPPGALPQVLTIPAGTVISVRLSQWLSSDQNRAGDTFSAELDQPIVVDGWVVARRPQSVLGRVVLAQKANHGNNESKLGLELAEITLVDGEQLTVTTELVQDSRTRSAGRDAATVGATTALGAIIGAAVGGGQGAAIGAGVGVAGGMAAVVSTSGRPTVLRPEQLLTFRLQSPVDIDTGRGHVAFRPVTQGDYGRPQESYENAPRLRYPGPGAPYPPPYPYAPYAPIAYPAPPYDYGYCGGPTLWSCYPGPLYFSLGLWGGWGFAPRGGVAFGRPGFRR